jgi:hypothetical protein
MRGEAAARLSRRPMTSTCARSQCQDSAGEAATGAVSAHDVHALRNAITAAGLFLVMQQLKVREDRAPTRWRPLIPGFTIPSEELDF